MRALPVVHLTPCPDTYAQLLAHGWDSLQEAYNFEVHPSLHRVIDTAQAAARQLGARGQGETSVIVGEVTYRIGARGTHGFKAVLACDDYLILVASLGTDWPVSIRYLAAGLWEHGCVVLRERALASLAAYTKPNGEDYVRVSRADYAFDFYSPAFASEFKPGRLSACAVAPSQVKRREHGKVARGSEKTKRRLKSGDLYTEWAVGGRGETYTLGSKAGVQVEIYNKSVEITDKSGKTWMLEIWAAGADGEIFEEHVFRIEVRMAGDYLKDRNIRRPDELMAARAALVTEALYARRITVPTSDSNRRRWPVHPLWSEAIRSADAKELVPLGRMVTGKRDALVKQQRAQISGTMRAFSALAKGSYDEAFLRAEFEDMLRAIPEDPGHREKMAELTFRYSDVEEAR